VLRGLLLVGDDVGGALDLMPMGRVWGETEVDVEIAESLTRREEASGGVGGVKMSRIEGGEG
jgi:hypothetical protein